MKTSAILHSTIVALTISSVANGEDFADKLKQEVARQVVGAAIEWFTTDRRPSWGFEEVRLGIHSTGLSTKFTLKSSNFTNNSDHTLKHVTATIYAYDGPFVGGELKGKKLIAKTLNGEMQPHSKIGEIALDMAMGLEGLSTKELGRKMIVIAFSAKVDNEVKPEVMWFNYQTYDFMKEEWVDEEAPKK